MTLSSYLQSSIRNLPKDKSILVNHNLNVTYINGENGSLINFDGLCNHVDFAQQVSVLLI